GGVALSLRRSKACPPPNLPLQPKEVPSSGQAGGGAKQHVTIDAGMTLVLAHKKARESLRGLLPIISS
ncbi:MAG: hypothetical protein WAM90_01135, partial [Rhodanobacter sp.]